MHLNSFLHLRLILKMVEIFKSDDLTHTLRLTHDYSETLRFMYLTPLALNQLQ